MPLGRRQRRIWLTLGLAVVALLGLWFSLPVWFPWVLRPLAARAKVQFARYQREGYSRFSLHSLSYTNQSVRCEADRVEALTPPAWLFRLATGAAKPGQPFLSVTDWRVESLPSTNAAAPVYSQVREAAAVFSLLDRWVPQAALSNGTLRIQQQALQIPAVTWSGGQIWTRVEREKLAAVVTADVRDAPNCIMQLNVEALRLQSWVQLTTNAARLSLQSTNWWASNRFEVQAEFGYLAVLPDHASLQAQSVRVPAELLQLPGYGDVRGSARAEWQNDRFDLELSASTNPLAGETNLPPLTLDLHAKGNTDHATITTAVLSAPWLRATLSRELTVHYDGQLVREPASLNVTADLDRQPWLPLEGTLNGTARFNPGTNRLPTTTFQLTGTGIGTPQLKTKSCYIEGGMEWPTLTLSHAWAAFADGSTASLSGQAALNQKRVDSGRFSFNGPLLRQWLPTGYGYEGLTAAGEFEGALTNLAHRGHLVVTNLTSPAFQPLGLVLDWQGQQNRLSEVTGQASARGSRVQAEGAADLEAEGVDLRLKAFTLQQDAKPVLSLAGPATIRLRQSQWSVDSLHCTGQGSDLAARGALSWPRYGSFDVSARNVHSELAQDLLKARLPAIELRSMNLSANWSNGPVKFGLKLSAAERPAASIGATTGSPARRDSGLQLAGTAKLTGDAQGLSVEKLEITSQGSSCAVLQGALPLTLNPAARQQLQIAPGSPFTLTGDLQPQGLLPDKLAAWTGIRWQEPRLHLQLSGTPTNPLGRLQLQVGQLQVAQSNQPLPALTDLHLDLSLDRQEARLTEGKVLIQGQPVSLTAQVPLGTGFWSALTPSRRPDWTKLSAHLRVPRTKLTAFADLYPEQFSQQGECEVDVSLLPGLELEGFLKLQGARTRPLPPIGSIRDIDVTVRCHKRTLALQSATASVGAGTVRLTGQADLADADWLASFSDAGAAKAFRAGKLLPPFSLHLLGTNVSLVRQPEAIVRGDLDFTVAGTNGAPPLLSGTARLHNSFFLADLASLAPGNIQSPSQRPPYFSVTNALLADWRLAAQVTGDRFLKMRTTLFNGDLSANLQLQGTLEKPVALGDVKVDSGMVRFPFGSLQVQQGLVSLTSENPYQPQLSVKALSTQFGYEINMQVSGTADAPVVQFSSNPPLSSEQILLLLSAGEMPRGTYSLSPQQRAQTLAMFLGREPLSQLGIGDTADQRLTIYSGEQITQTGTPTYSIEFKLSDNYSLVGEYDRFGDYNAGIKWRIYSK